MFGRWPFDSSRNFSRPRRAARPGLLFGGRKAPTPMEEIEVRDVELKEALEEKEEEYRRFSGKDGLFWRMLKMDVEERRVFLKNVVGVERRDAVEGMFVDWLEREWVSKGVSDAQLEEIDRHADEECGAYTFIRYFYPSALVEWVYDKYKEYKGAQPEEEVVFP